MHQTKRESSSELGPILKAKDINELLSYMDSTEEDSEESLEALDELIRRAALYSALLEENKSLKAQLKTRTVVVAPESTRGQ